MQVYFSPLAAPTAARISLYEAGADASFVEVDPFTKTMDDGADYRAVNPLGLVPALRTDDGVVLTENAAILQWIARTHGAGKLAPTDDLGQTQLQQWLCFVGTELHKGLFAPLLDRKAPDVAKAYALEKGRSRLDFVDARVKGRTFLLESFSVADAYLVTVLGWSVATPIRLAEWPNLAAYAAGLQERPSVARAIREERPLYVREMAKHRV